MRAIEIVIENISRYEDETLWRVRRGRNVLFETEDYAVAVKVQIAAERDPEISQEAIIAAATSENTRGRGKEPRKR